MHFDFSDTNALTHRRTCIIESTSAPQPFCSFVAVDLGMTLLPGKRLFLSPSFFYCLPFMG